MKTSIKYLLALAIALTSMAAFTQEFQEDAPLPADPAVISGKLDNGLIYYPSKQKT